MLGIYSVAIVGLWAHVRVSSMFIEAYYSQHVVHQSRMLQMITSAETKIFLILCVCISCVRPGNEAGVPSASFP